MPKVSYHDKINKLYNTKLRVILDELPPYCRYYFNAKATTFQKRTAYAYASDLKVFFKYLMLKNPALSDLKMKDIPADSLNDLSSHEIDDYMMYLTDYHMDGTDRHNSNSGKNRKLASLKSFCKYLIREGIIQKNPADLVDIPRLRGNDIIALTDFEVKALFHVIETAEGMTERQTKIHKYCKQRDYAILMLLLGTGIRVSELVGLDISDVDLKNNSAKVVRKGGWRDHVYFSPQVRDAILSYLSPEDNHKGTRAALHPEDSEQALFVSRKRKRLTVRAVQKMLQTYSEIAFGKDNELKVSPHKMRKTYGTKLYLDTNDIRLVADTLGHSSVNTTSKHYIATTEEHKRIAAIDVLSY